jgi:hypothetical protein
MKYLIIAAMIFIGFGGIWSFHKKWYPEAIVAAVWFIILIIMLISVLKPTKP